MDVSLESLRNSKSVKTVFHIGVVEDINDPEGAGRCRVRIFGVHIKEKASGKNHLKTKELPWANVMLPSTVGGSAGVASSTTMVNGTWVVVVFENNDYQHPLVLGVVKGIVKEKQTDDPNLGFTDPDKVYPLITRLGEPETNRLNRNQNYDKTAFALERDPNLEKDIGITPQGDDNDERWSMPTELNTKSVYPQNTIKETSSGHIIEMDDTPGNERLHVWHKSGSFVEFRPDGTMSMKVVTDRYEVTNGNEYKLVNGARKTTIDNDDDKTVGGDEHKVIGGKMFHRVNDIVSIKSGHEIFLSANNIFLN